MTPVTQQKYIETIKMAILLKQTSIVITGISSGTCDLGDYNSDGKS